MRRTDKKKPGLNKHRRIFHRLNLRFAFLFTGISGSILLTMSFLYLYLSEKDLANTSYLSFCGEMNTYVANLEQQTIISYDWLSKIEQNGKYRIAIYDNETPLSYNNTAHTEELQKLFDSLFKTQRLDFTETTGVGTTSSIHKEFPYKMDSDHPYYVSISQITQNKHTVTSILLYSTKGLQQKLKGQRLYFLLLDGCGVLLLFAVSLFFTKKLLQPIQSSQEQQTTFIAAASHELRTPLAVILSSLSAMEGSNEDMRDQFLHTIATESKRMSTLVNDMLTLARADSQTWSFTMKRVELDTLLLDTYEAFEPLACKHHLTLKICLPDASIPTCTCDPQRISQVLSILLSNALSYSNPNGTITLKLYYTTGHFYLSIVDQGIGISDEAKQHIFDRFYREDSSRSTKEHFGLGLSIAKEIIDAHQGTILVSDTPGGGTTFQLIL
ncbi:sensor histidine kinase [Anaerosporobacter faecicola]|uniref:sensor histidine kinase n=1 Tax=Anaerosporobacter faecicola TaxID=2718714 RepID=UPI001438D80A|nr:HAMP domain-containing sensor histidine kinase [Anaerosporobacter faecicola]